jgi:hypothetical protein
VRVGSPVVLDGTGSTGDAPLSCTWSFENADGSTVWETISGCKITKTFTTADTKYVRLIVTDADGDSDSNEQSFPVAAASDVPAEAVWTAPSNVKVGSPVVLDGTRSTGDAPLSCTWSFENADGSTVWETISGCKITKTFTTADTKYVRLIVDDANGSTDSNKQSFVARR